MDVLKIDDEKVKKATGRTWKRWFYILNKFGAKKYGHYETAKYLAAKYKIGAWWAQTVTVRYEKEKGYWIRHGK